jgi:hypothetical protein
MLGMLELLGYPKEGSYLGLQIATRTPLLIQR